MTTSRGLLQNWAILVVVLLTSFYGSAASWLSIRRPVGPAVGPVLIIGLGFAIFITGSIAYRSRFLGDRVVFAALAGALLLAAIRVMVPLGFPWMLAVSVAKSLLWTIASLAGLAVLTLSFRPSRMNRHG
jgi:apolipoprotein N-acyltransferase